MMGSESFPKLRTLDEVVVVMDESDNVLRGLGKGAKRLLEHEKQLISAGQLDNKTHKGASSIWLTGLALSQL